MTSLALFDLDSTLLDREKAFALWTKQFLEVHGLSEDALPTIERVDADGYNPREQFFSELRRELGITNSIDELLADYYVEYPSKYAVEPEVIGAVRSLRAAEFKVGVVTQRASLSVGKVRGCRHRRRVLCSVRLVGHRRTQARSGHLRGGGQTL